VVDSKVGSSWGGWCFIGLVWQILSFFPKKINFKHSTFYITSTTFNNFFFPLFISHQFFFFLIRSHQLFFNDFFFFSLNSKLFFLFISYQSLLITILKNKIQLKNLYHPLIPWAVRGGVIEEY